MAFSNGKIMVIGGTNSSPDEFLIETLNEDESAWVGVQINGDFVDG